MINIFGAINMKPFLATTTEGNKREQKLEAKIQEDEDWFESLYYTPLGTLSLLPLSTKLNFKVIVLRKLPWLGPFEISKDNEDIGTTILVFDPSCKEPIFIDFQSNASLKTSLLSKGDVIRLKNAEVYQRGGSKELKISVEQDVKCNYNDY